VLAAGGAYPSLRIFYEIDKVKDFGARAGDCLLEFFEGMGSGQAAVKEYLKGEVELMYGVFCELAAPKAHEIKAVYVNRMTVAGRIRRYVLHYLGAAPDNGNCAHPHELVYRH